MKKNILLLASVSVILFGSVLFVSANHSWGGYHWARTSNPFTLKLGNNTSGTWTGLLATASSDWSQSNVLDTVVVAGSTRPKTCRPTAGRDEICNANYGNTGWLGVAQIWINSQNHITQGTVKNNDYYFGSSSYTYNNESEKLHVICQEMGHTLGLDHQSTDGTSLNTCMDYYNNTSNADTLSTHPNQHDYDELAIIYGHVDSTTTIKSTASTKGNSNVDSENPSDWGKEVSHDAKNHRSTFEKDLGNGDKIVTLVIWTN